MTTNLHKIRYPMVARSLRVKLLLDLRKTKRLQVFFGHRFRHFLASDERIHKYFQAICDHLHPIGSYSIDEKFTTLLLVMINQAPQIVDYVRIDWDASLLEDIYNQLNTIISSICYVLNEIDINYPLEHKHSIGNHFECDRLTLRPNVNSICNLMADLLSQLLQTFSNQCKTHKVRINNDILYMFELYYQQFGNNRELIERNLHTLFALTHGMGRFERTKSIVEYESLMHRLFGQHVDDSVESLIVLRIANSISKGFPENIHFLLASNVLGFVKNQLTSSNQPRYETIEESLNILENICGNHRNDIQAVIDADLIPILINGSIEHLKVLLDHDLLHLLCCQLRYQVNIQENLSEATIEMMKNILDGFYRKDHRTFHTISNVINDCGGYMTIKLLTSHSDESISSAAYNLTEFGSSACDKCNQIPFHTMTESLQYSMPIMEL